MKSKIIAFALLTVGLLAAAVSAESIFEGRQITEITHTTTAVFMNGGRVFKIYNSSNAANTTLTNFSQLIDTQTIIGQVSYNSFARDNIKSPALLFFSTPTINSNYTLAMDYGEKGIFISTGCFIWKTEVSSGNAVKTYVEWSK